MDSFDYFSNNIFPPLILGFGLVGNFLGFKVMQRPKMLEIGPRNTYKYLFIADTMFLVQIIVTYLQLTFNIDATIISTFICKLWYYLNYSLDSQSSMLLAYISIDRYVSIKMPAYRYFMRKRNNQLIYFIFIFMLNLVYFLPVVYNYSIIVDTNKTVSCSFINEYSQELISYMDLIFRVIVPSIIIMIFSLLLGLEVIKSRKRILANFQREENIIFLENISLALTSICFNIIYIILQIPISVYFFLPNYTQISYFSFVYYLFYLSYSINFYIICISNSLFRKELVSLLKSLKK